MTELNLSLIYPHHKDYPDKCYLPTYTDDVGAASEIYLSRPNCVNVEVERRGDLKVLTIDFGGMIGMDEPFVDLEVGGFVFHVRMLHLEHLVSKLQREDRGGLQFFNNWMTNVALTKRVARVLHCKANAARMENEEQMDAIADKLASAAQQAGIVHKPARVNKKRGGLEHL